MFLKHILIHYFIKVVYSLVNMENNNEMCNLNSYTAVHK